MQYLTKGEYQPRSSLIEPFSKQHSHEHHGYEHYENAPTTTQSEVQHHHHDTSSSIVHSQHHQHHHPHHDAQVNEAPSSQTSTRQHEPSSFVSGDAVSSVRTNEDSQAEVSEEQIHAQGLPPPRPKEEQEPPPFQPSMSSWDAQR